MGRRRVPAPPLRTSPFTSDPFPAPASDGLVVVELGVALRREQVEDVVLVHGLADEHDVGPRPERDAGADGQWQRGPAEHDVGERRALDLSLIHISEPTRLGMISYAVFCL